MDRSLQVQEEARRWVGTRFHHQGRRCKSANDAGGVDCLGLLIGVAATLQLKDRTGGDFAQQDCTDYSRQPDAVQLRARLQTLLYEQPCGVPPAPAHIGLFRCDDRAQHLGIFAKTKGEEGLSLIHAYAPARRVVEHGLDAYWMERLVAVYALPCMGEEGEEQAE